MKSLVSCHGAAVLGVLLLISPPRAAADSGTVTFISGNSITTNGPFTLGETGPDNLLFINLGGKLTNTIGTIGKGPDANGNLAIVSSPGSSWRNTSNFILGATGSLNQLTVTDSGRAGAGWDTIVGLHASATNNILLIDGPGSTFDLNLFTLGLNSSGNQVVVNNGGRLNGGVSFDRTYRIGSNTLANDNLLQVTGSGSSATTDHLTVGYLGSRNILEILGGARFTNAAVVLGRETNSTGNRATLSGANSVWQFVNSGLFLGLNGRSNSVSVSGGALLFPTDTTIGFGPSASNNTALVTGANSLWYGLGATVGLQGADNSFAVSSGARLRTSPLVIGDSSAGNRVIVTDATLDVISATLGGASNAANNELLVSGPSAFFTNTSSIIVGSNGSFNRFILTNGARMLTAAIFTSPVTLGHGPASRSNLLVVSGPNTQIVGQRALEIGRSGSGNRAVFSDGTFVQTRDARIDAGCSSNNFLLVTDPGTIWTNGSILVVGQCGSGNSLLISNGARVLAQDFRTTLQAGGGNRAMVSGALTHLSCSQSLSVGALGSADVLAISDGAFVAGRNDLVGNGGGSNRALVFGAGTIWTNLSLIVGEAGMGNQLTLSNAAQMTSGNATVGSGTSARSTEAMIIAGASWMIRSNLTVGQNGASARLAVSASGSLSNGTAKLGVSAPATNCVAVIADLGSLWTTDAELWIGGLGRQASLIISNGARVRSGVGVVDASRFTSPPLAECSELDLSHSAMVSGPGSVWECRTNLILGTFGRGNTLTIRNDGLVTSPALILGDASVSLSNFLCSATPGRNLLTVDNGDLVVTNAARTGVLEIRNGVVFMQRGSIVLDELRATNRNYGRFHLLGGSARLRRASLGNVLPLVIGDGLSATLLTVDESGPGLGWGILDAPAGVVVRPHGTLSGGANISGSVSNAGTLRPGGQDGAYFSIASLALGPSSALHFDIDGRLYTTNYHPITVGSPLSLRGALRVTLQGGFVPVPGDVFSVIGCTQITNSFDNVALGGRVTTTDGLGSFLVNFNGFNINLSNYQSADLDGDGIEDAWATNYFGHTPLTPAERAADADGDGASNADEFHAGTNPNIAASVLHAMLSFIGGRPAVSFPCVDGKRYRLRVSDDLLTWRMVNEPAFTYPAPGLCSWIDDGTDTGGLGVPTRFYRIVVE